MKTLFIEPGSPWANGFIESFNRKLRDKLLNREIFDTLLEAKVLIERWGVHYNTVQLHSSLGYRPPDPEVVVATRHSNQITTQHVIPSVGATGDTHSSRSRADSLTRQPEKWAM